MLASAKAFAAKDDRVDLIDRKVEDHGMLAITSFYVGFLLPMMVEVQWWDFKGRPPAERGRGARLTHPLRFGAFAPKAGSSSTRVCPQPRRGRAPSRSPRSPSASGTTTCGSTTTSRPCRREPTHVFEAFTTLAALAQHTSRIRLGQLVTCASYRNAGLLAKEAATVDVVSGGRLIFGLGAGWYEREYEAYGYEYLSAGERLAVLEETVDVIKRLWTEETVTHHGKHLHFEGAYCDPKPLQQLPEIWIGGGGERVTLRIAAQHADATNWQVGLDEFVHKSKVLQEHCDRLGRDFDTDRAHARPRLPVVRHRGRHACVARQP